MGSFRECAPAGEVFLAWVKVRAEPATWKCACSPREERYGIGTQ